MKRIAAVLALLGAVALFRPSPAQAGVSWSVVLPGVALWGGPPPPPPPVVYAPPVYYPPAPAYYPPPPVVYVPRPYYPTAVFYGGSHGHGHGRRGWSGHGHR